jgi:hypothetical protein
VRCICFKQAQLAEVAMMKALETEATRAQIQGHENYTDSPSRPIYKRVEPAFFHGKDGQYVDLDGVDLEDISGWLLHNFLLGEAVKSSF